MKLLLPTVTMLALALAACSGKRTDDTAATPANTPAPAVPADQPVRDVPPTTAPAPAPAAPSAAEATQGSISYTGFGPAKFGDSAESVRMAWGKDIKADTPSEPGGCHYLHPQPRPQGGYGVGFMIEADKFARIDVDNADIAAPGGGRVGMSADEIRKLYAGRVEEQGHKYVEGGKYLRVKDAAGSNGLLVFSTDAAGKVTEWRIGVPPQVEYVEGCS